MSEKEFKAVVEWLRSRIDGPSASYRLDRLWEHGHTLRPEQRAAQIAGVIALQCVEESFI